MCLRCISEAAAACMDGGHRNAFVLHHAEARSNGTRGLRGPAPASRGQHARRTHHHQVAQLADACLLALLVCAQQQDGRRMACTRVAGSGMRPAMQPCTQHAHSHRVVQGVFHGCIAAAARHSRAWVRGMGVLIIDAGDARARRGNRGMHVQRVPSSQVLAQITHRWRTTQTIRCNGRAVHAYCVLLTAQRDRQQSNKDATGRGPDTSNRTQHTGAHCDLSFQPRLQTDSLLSACLSVG